MTNHDRRPDRSPPLRRAAGAMWSRADLIVALVALLVAASVAVFVGLETQCQRRLNQAAADESAATADLVDAIFTSDQLDEQLGAYAAYRKAMGDITRRRAALGCGG